MTDIANYCTCFIDLLGQQEKFQGQGIIPAFKNQEERERFDNIVNDTIGAISQLQADSSIMRQQFTHDKLSAQYQALSNHDKQLMDEMRRHVSTEQRWSDGLVYFASLAEVHSKCPMNAVIDIFFSAGTLCLLGLAYKVPLRGGIEIGWGVEINPGELYGAGLANAYNIESQKAKYPRIVIGMHTFNYLSSVAETKSNGDKLVEHNKQLANLCLSFLKIDSDGQYIIDYFGDSFVAAIMPDGTDKDLYLLGEKFINEQLQLHSLSNNHKLLKRYQQLKAYFDLYSHRYKTDS